MGAGIQCVRVMALTGLLAWGAGCKKGPSPRQEGTEPGGPAGKAVAISAQPAAPGASDAAAAAEESAALPCKLEGEYRVRFFSNGHQGWWFRFVLDGEKARLLEEVPMLSLTPGPIESTLDDEACAVELSAASSNAGAVRVSLSLKEDRRTLAGRLQREKAHNDKEKDVELVGAFTAKGELFDHPCVTPGLYEVSFDPSTSWRTEDEFDDRDCSQAAQFASPIVIRVEPMGEELAVTMREVDAPYGEHWSDDETTRKGECTADIALADETTTLEAGLIFAKTGVTGLARKASYQIVEDGTAGENIWTCVGENLPLTVKKLP